MRHPPVFSALRSSELFFVLGFLAILCTLVVLAKIQAYRVQDGLVVSVLPPIEVRISGAVAHPGVFIVASGSPLKEILIKAKPQRYANLAALDLDSPVYSACELVILPLAEILVYVEGGCEAEALKMPVGARVSDLKKRVKLHPQADLAVFKSKRLLQHEETIKIPLKK